MQVRDRGINFYQGEDCEEVKKTLQSNHKRETTRYMDFSIEKQQVGSVVLVDGKSFRLNFIRSRECCYDATKAFSYGNSLP